MGRSATQGLTPTEDDGTGETIFVEAIEGPGKGSSCLLGRAPMIVGSGDDCALKLDDGAVSRAHAELARVKGAVHVRDLGSKNGTRYLEARITEAKVPLGGSVTMGRTRLVFRSATAEAPLSDRMQLHGLVGGSLRMRQLYAILEKLAATETTVLVLGETGTGKELAARALHASSARRERPFVVFDCATTSSELMESALYGHVQGAFTGADRGQLGAVEQAKGGTLFLDGISELPLSEQPKLLRLIGSGEFRPVGAPDAQRADVRIVASTQADLELAVTRGTFRRDLYFRLAGAVVQMPPLAARLDDIPRLVEHFASGIGTAPFTLGPETLASFVCREWKGNLRELKNAVERALALGATGASSTPDAPSPSMAELMFKVEHDYLAQLLARHPGNVSAAAREAKVARSQFYRLLERHGF